MPVGLEYPRTVNIDTLNVCNARCPFCPLFAGDSQMDRTIQPAKIMGNDVFERIVSQIAAWPVRPRIVIAPNGEALQDSGFIDKVQILHRFGLQTTSTVLTNAALLNERNGNAILDAGINQVAIGFDGASKAVYEAHRARLNYEKTLANIRRFAQTRSERGAKTRIFLRFVRTKENAHEVQAAYDLFSEFLDEQLDWFDDSLAMDWGDSPAKYEGYYFFPQVQDRPRVSGCIVSDATLNIHSDATVSACCWDYNLEVSEGGFGNATEKTLIDIWRGNARTSFARKLADTETPLTLNKCKTCIWAHKMDEVPASLWRLPEELLLQRTSTGSVYRISRGYKSSQVSDLPAMEPTPG